jgi:phytoene dehydrogenase-like protein
MNAAPPVLARLMGEKAEYSIEDEGAVFKINMLLKKLPKLACPNVDPMDAFAGTFHINEGYSQMQQSYIEAKMGKLPVILPSEIYCHTLTDASILSPFLAQQGYHTLTLFGLDTLYSLFAEPDGKVVKEKAVRQFLQGLNAYLAEPIEDCIAKDNTGALCIEAKSPVDLERELGMPKGNIFHNPLSWFFSESKLENGNWGVETAFDRIYICGSGAKRGGAVSGIPGHNAAMKVLAIERKLL